MDEQDGAITGQPDALTAETGPHGDLEDGGSFHDQEGLGRPSDADTGLPGDEDSTRNVAMDSAGGEGGEVAMSANDQLDLAQ